MKVIHDLKATQRHGDGTTVEGTARKVPFLNHGLGGVKMQTPELALSLRY